MSDDIYASGPQEACCKVFIRNIAAGATARIMNFIGMAEIIPDYGENRLTIYSAADRANQAEMAMVKTYPV